MGQLQLVVGLQLQHRIELAGARTRLGKALRWYIERGPLPRPQVHERIADRQRGATTFTAGHTEPPHRPGPVPVALAHPIKAQKTRHKNAGTRERFRLDLVEVGAPK